MISTRIKVNTTNTTGNNTGEVTTITSILLENPKIIITVVASTIITRMAQTRAITKIARTIIKAPLKIVKIIRTIRDSITQRAIKAIMGATTRNTRRAQIQVIPIKGRRKDQEIRTTSISHLKDRDIMEGTQSTPVKIITNMPLRKNDPVLFYKSKYYNISYQL